MGGQSTEELFAAVGSPPWLKLLVFCAIVFGALLLFLAVDTYRTGINATKFKPHPLVSRENNLPTHPLERLPCRLLVANYGGQPPNVSFPFSPIMSFLPALLGSLSHARNFRNWLLAKPYANTEHLPQRCPAPSICSLFVSYFGQLFAHIC